MKRIILTAICVAFAAISAHAKENLIINGDFSDSEDPFKGWMVDYQWLKNKHFMNNHNRISVEKNAGVYRNAAKMVHPNGWTEIKMESDPIKFEQGQQYTCTMDIKGKGTRVYFSGYKWKPGIRPHDAPKDGELRMIYKSKPVAGSYNNWKRITFSIPGLKPSATALKHLRYVRFIRVFVWTGSEDKGSPEVLIDNVVVTKAPSKYK